MQEQLRCLSIFCEKKTNQIKILIPFSKNHSRLTVGGKKESCGEGTYRLLSHKHSTHFCPNLKLGEKIPILFFLQCHQKLEQGLERQHTKLQKTLEELRDYQKQHEKWAKMNSKVIGIQSIPNFPWFQVNSVQAPLEMRVASRLSYERFTFLTEGQIIALPLKWWVMSKRWLERTQ